MNNDIEKQDVSSINEHEWSQDQLPWLVNSTLGDDDKQRLNKHLLDCKLCQKDFQQQRQWQQLMVRESTLEYAPQSSLQRMMNRIDKPSLLKTWSLSFANSLEKLSYRLASVRTRSKFGLLIIGTQTASVFVLALVVGWHTWRSDYPIEEGIAQADTNPSYQTLSSPAGILSSPHLQVVFEDRVTLEEIKSLLQVMDARIASGPSEQGVFRIDVKSGKSIELSADWLRRQSGVMFVAVKQNEMANPQ